MASKIQIRRDTVANWNAVAGSVILAAGEIGYETDTRNLKIGDGISVWSALKYQAPVYSGTNSTLAAATLAVDQTNNRVGIGNSSPNAKIQVTDNNPTRGIVGVVTNSGTSSLTGTQIQITQNTVQDYVIGQPAGVDAFAIWRGRNTGADGTERLRISSTGNVGIGTSAPSDQLHIEGAGPIIRLKDTTSTTAEYATIDADTSTGSISINANQGNLAGVTGTALVALKVNTTERLRANGTGVAVSGVLSTSGLYTASAGITVPTGQTVTIASGATLSVPSGATLSVAGTVALPAGSVEIADLANIATLTVLGNSTGAAAAVTALTSGISGTARTALGIPGFAYGGIIVNATLAAIQNFTLSNTTVPSYTLSITANEVNVEYWYKVTSISMTSSGSPKFADVFVTVPTGFSAIFAIEDNYGVGAGLGITYAPASTAGRVHQAATVATIRLSNSSGSVGLAGIAAGWFSVKKIVTI